MHIGAHEVHDTYAVLAAADFLARDFRNGIFAHQKFAKNRLGLNSRMTKSRFVEYHRLGMACLEMARQSSDLPDVQAHWLMMAQSWFRLARKADDPPSDPSKDVPSKSG